MLLLLFVPSAQHTDSVIAHVVMQAMDIGRMVGLGRLRLRFLSRTQSLFSFAKKACPWSVCCFESLLASNPILLQCFCCIVFFFFFFFKEGIVVVVVVVVEMVNPCLAKVFQFFPAFTTLPDSCIRSGLVCALYF